MVVSSGETVDVIDHSMELIDDCLISVFTFLTEEDLLSASAVCKVRSSRRSVSVHGRVDRHRVV